MAVPVNHTDEGLKELLQKAIDLDTRGLSREACRAYLTASRILLRLSKGAALPKVRDLYYRRAQECVQRILVLTGTSTRSPTSTPSPRAPTEPVRRETRHDDEDDMPLDEVLSDTIIRERPTLRMSDVAGLEDAKQAIYEAVVFPIKYPHLFKGRTRQPWRGILLYGPAGTGKTLLVKAVASEINATFFNVSAGNLVSKWLGESERLVMHLFRMAREHQPAVIFIDELDSIGVSRSGNDVGGERRLKTQLLTEIQGLNTSPDDRVTLIAATNLPWEIDFALLSRFERKIYVPLPDAHSRIEIFKIHMADVEVADDVDYSELAELTAGYSGRDISIVCREAAMAPIRDLIQNGSPSENIEVRAVVLNDFLRAIKQITPVTTPEDIRRYDEWLEGSY